MGFDSPVQTSWGRKWQGGAVVDVDVSFSFFALYCSFLFSIVTLFSSFVCDWGDTDLCKSFILHVERDFFRFTVTLPTPLINDSSHKMLIKKKRGR